MKNKFEDDLIDLLQIPKDLYKDPEMTPDKIPTINIEKVSEDVDVDDKWKYRKTFIIWKMLRPGDNEIVAVKNLFVRSIYDIEKNEYFPVFILESISIDKRKCSTFQALMIRLLNEGMVQAMTVLGAMAHDPRDKKDGEFPYGDKVKEVINQDLQDTEKLLQNDEFKHKYFDKPTEKEEEDELFKTLNRRSKLH